MLSALQNSTVSITHATRLFTAKTYQAQYFTALNLTINSKIQYTNHINMTRSNSTEKTKDSDGETKMRHEKTRKIDQQDEPLESTIYLPYRCGDLCEGFKLGH